MARKKAPAKREITALSPQTGRAQYEAAPLFHFESADYGKVPQVRPTFAYFQFAQQLSVKLNKKIGAFSWSNWCGIASFVERKGAETMAPSAGYSVLPMRV
ncbi:MAG: hypothetical protein AAF748_02485 [Pseudomonadota bacterium]